MSITAEDAKVIAQTINGALGSALDRLVSGKIVGSVIPTSGRNGKSEAVEIKALKPDQFVPAGDLPLPRTLDADATEKLYQVFKRRMIDDARVDPILLHLLTQQNEIRVEVERQVVRLDGGTLKGRCARLMAQGWFVQPKTTAATRRELARVGTDPSGNDNLRKALADYRAQGFLTEEGDGWQIAPGVSVSEEVISKP